MVLTFRSAPWLRLRAWPPASRWPNSTAPGPDATSLAIIVGLAVGLVVGSAIGVLNGVTVAILRVSPFMVTLGTMSIALGVALYATRGVPVYGLPDEFTREFGRLRWFNLPVSVYLTAGMIAVLWWIMNWTRLGRYIYAIGGNIHASRVSGIPTIAYIIITYTMCSFLAAVTGVLLTARVGSGEATLGTTLMLESIAAAVIGGVSLRGGVGRVELVALGRAVPGVGGERHEPPPRGQQDPDDRDRCGLDHRRRPRPNEY